MPKMMNVTLENYKTQCDSRVFIFPKMGTYKEVINADTGAVLEKKDLSIVDVPERLAPLLAEQMMTKGVFLIPENPNEFEEAKRQALIRYVNGRLKTRITNFVMQKDEYERRGSTFQFSDEFEEAIRWDKEIRHVLNQQRPIRESGSFLEHFNVAPMPGEPKATDSASSSFEGMAKAKYPARKGRPKAGDLGISLVEEANG